MIRKVVSLLPASVIRFIGRIQFRVPFLSPIINAVAERAISGEGTIQRGAGKGLRFDATYCNPGYLAGTTEPEEQERLLDALEAGDVFYNLGANAGFYAVIAARAVGEEGYVYAFEPTPKLADRIRYNAQINGFEHVSVVEAAVCNKNGSVEFRAAGFDARNSIKNARPDNSIEVRAVTLDAWAADRRSPDVIMMDIEGAELDALRGAKELIRRHRPTMLIEVHWLGEEFVDFVDRELKPLGYEATTYSGNSLPTSKVHRYHALLTPSRAPENGY